MVDSRGGLSKLKSPKTMPSGYLDWDKAGRDYPIPTSQPKNELGDRRSEGKHIHPLVPTMKSTQLDDFSRSRHRAIRFWNRVGLFGTLVLSLLLVFISRFSFPFGRINSHNGPRDQAAKETTFFYGSGDLDSDKKPSYNTEAVRFDNYSLFIKGQRVFLQ
jgi:hypothetical protein